MNVQLTPRPLDERLVAPALPLRSVAASVLVLALVVGATVVLHPLAPLAAAALVVGVATAWQRPVMAAVLVAAICPAIAGLQRGLGLPFFKLSEALLLVVTAVVLARRPLAGLRWRAADWALLALALLGAVFGAVHVLQGTSPAETFLRVGLQPTLLFLTWWTASRSVRTPADLAVVLRWVLVASTVPATLAVLQAVDFPGVRRLLVDLVAGPLLAQEGAAGVVRVTGPFPIWHSLAAFLVPAVTVGAVLLLRRDVRVLSLPVLAGVVLVDVAALVLTVTITAIAWAVAAVLVVAALQRRLAAALVLVSALGLAASLLFAAPIAARVEAQFSADRSSSTEVPQTLAYRVSVWERDFLPLLERAVPYGVSNELPESVIFQNTENQYIALTLRGGVLLLLGAIAAMTALGIALSRVVRGADGLTRVAAGAVLAVLLLLPVAALVWPYLTNAGFPQAWLPLAGAVVGAAGAAGRR